MTRVIAYSYDADYHCESCMLNYAREVPFSDYDWQDYDEEDVTDYPNRPGFIQLDKAVELEIIKDSENNPIHPLFSTDEWWEPSITELQVLTCGDCGAELDTYEGE